MGVLNKLFGRFLLESDPSATTQTTAVIQSLSGSIAIVPSGSGAFTLQVPDGTAAGGNARGEYAIDLQRVRSFASYVASGTGSIVIGGISSRATGNYAIAAGDSARATQAHAIALGNDAKADGALSIAIGKNNSSQSNYSTTSGGEANTASTNTHATVVGGYQNSSTGQYSISGGYSNVASGQGAVALGYDNTASGVRSVAIGDGNQASGSRSVALGRFLTASGENSAAFNLQSQATARMSTAHGFRSKAYLYGQFSLASDSFSATTGQAQQSSLTAKKQDTLTSGTNTTLFLNELGTTDTLIPDGTNRVWNVTIKYTAVVTSITGTATGVSVGDCKNEVLTIGFKRIGGTSSVVGSLNTLSTNEDSSMSTASFGVTAGSSQEMKLDFTAPTFTGGGSVTTRVVAKVELTEVAY